MERDFIDVASKAAELGVSEAVARSRALSGRLPCYGFLANDVAATKDGALPEWNEELFPYSDWDEGAPSNPERHPSDPLRGKGRVYSINGWFRLSGTIYQDLLLGKTVNLHGKWVWIFDADESPLCPLVVSGKRVWVTETEGGYHDHVGSQLRPEDCMFLSQPTDETAVVETNGLRSDARATYARIIAALWSKAHGSGEPGRLSSDPYTAAASLSEFLAKAGLEKPSKDKIGRILSDEVPATGIRIGKSDRKP